MSANEFAVIDDWANSIVRETFTLESAQRELELVVQTRDRLSRSMRSAEGRFSRAYQNGDLYERDRINHEMRQIQRDLEQVVSRISFLQNVVSQIQNAGLNGPNTWHFSRRRGTSDPVPVEGTVTGRFSSNHQVQAQAAERVMQQLRIEPPDFEEIERRIFGRFSGPPAPKKPKGVWPEGCPLVKVEA